MSENNVKRGTLFVYSGCSGVGKGTIMKELMEADSSIKLSVSATTREPREGEENGVHYFFVSKDEFEKMIEEDGFLEHEEYCDNFYGTPKRPVEEMLSQGFNVFLEIEVKGAVSIINRYPEAVSIFILPPSLDELERRLRSRGTEEEETIRKRLETAIDELKIAAFYKYQVVNNDLQKAVEEILHIVKTNTA
ncbi:MAG: guanylate kinase [Ruminococcaceae bacterium]|nr:guanylate kinase [Oscillospiraceae bacterium]